MDFLESAVVDANVLMHSRGQLQVGKVLLPLSVRDEVQSSMSRMKMEKFSIDARKPGQESVEKVRDKSREIHSPTSEQDEEALALAIQESVPLVTDDKALQNLALHLDAEFRGFNTGEVGEKRCWKLVCDNCGRDVSTSPCRCGSRSTTRKRDQCS